VENWCKFVVSLIKIVQKGIGDIVFPSREPLGVFLDAFLEEEGDVMSFSLDADFCLNWVNAVTNCFSEIGLGEPTRGR